MEDQLITFETATLAKEKGFDVVVSTAWYQNKQFPMSSYKTINAISQCSNDDWVKQGDPQIIAAPTQSLLARWLREEHNINILSSHYKFVTKLSDGWYWSIGMSIKTDPICGTYESYEDAMEQGLKEALKLIKQ